MSTATSVTPLCVDERAAAAALGLSVSWLQRDRSGARLIPHLKLKGAVRYNLDRCRDALVALEQGGPKAQA